MGKGEIISHIGDGQYSVKLLYDHRRPDTMIGAIDEQVVDLDARIAVLSDGSQKSLLRLQRSSLLKRKQYLTDNVIKDRTTTAWCADLTEDLTGQVGTIEINGERESGVQIQPGHDGNAVYDADRDGQLQSAAAGHSSAVYYNLAMLPGWQKWMPTYRYGTITAIDGDICSVKLDAAQSSAQSLGINLQTALTNVPIEYMNCNGSAFEVGDHVVVQFTPVKGQTTTNWNTAKVIGFREEPKSCGLIFNLVRGDGEPVTTALLTLLHVTKSDGGSVGFDYEEDADIPGRWVIDITGEGDSEGYYVWYNCQDGLYTLYGGEDNHGKYKAADGVYLHQPPAAYLVELGEHSDIIPYWDVETEFVNVDNPGGSTTCTRYDRPQIGGTSIIIPAAQSLIHRLSIKTSIPYRVVRKTESHPTSDNLSDHWLFPYDLGSGGYCYSYPGCSNSVGTDTGDVAAAQIVGGAIDQAVTRTNTYSVTDYEYFGDGVPGGRNHDFTVENTTPTTGVSSTCSLGPAPPGSYDGELLNIVMRRNAGTILTIYAQYGW